MPLTGGTLSGALTATKFTGDGSGLTNIPAGKLTGTIDIARLPDLSNKYLSLVGEGEVIFEDRAFSFQALSNSNCITIASDGITFTDLNGDNTELTSISDSKGTSSTIATSQKCLNDNYFPLTGGIIKGDTTVLGSNGQYGVKLTNGDIQFVSDGGSSVVGTITGISDSTGTSSTIALSQKGASANYLANSGGTLSGSLGISSGDENSTTIAKNYIITTNGDYTLQINPDGFTNTSGVGYG